ncbi:zinc finger MIZ domain-containing protein 1-like [Stegodyphus dumicola]|uniref:zinc finger MIZ domain-containing protein 1-like n=1 Tax=Stegodyphus dumicola TaxID=202533 RepID=UPI0015A83DEF|nr:zinc finger MIZ domain-containing protein 1-like [Stegodyphus dumicola]
MFSVFSTELFSRADLEVEVQCYKCECEQNHSLHPLCLEINSQHFFIKWENSDMESLDVRKYLVWGKNILSTIAHKLCKHNIALFLGHRPAINSVLNRILPRDLLPSVYTRKRIKKIVRGEYFLPLSRICPISKTKMEFPVRFPGCKHLKCFDMLKFLELISDIRNNWVCAICSLKPAVKRFEVDEFLWNILNKIQKEGEIVIVNVKGAMGHEGFCSCLEYT